MGPVKKPARARPVDSSDDVFVGKAVKDSAGRTVGVVAAVDRKGFEVVRLNRIRERFTWEQLMAAQGQLAPVPEPAEPTEEIRAERGTQGGVVAVAYRIDRDGHRRLDRIVGDGADEYGSPELRPCPNPGVCRGVQHPADLVDGVWLVNCPFGRRAWDDDALARGAVPPDARPDVSLRPPGQAAPEGAKTTGWSGGQIGRIR